ATLHAICLQIFMWYCLEDRAQHAVPADKKRKAVLAKGFMRHRKALVPHEAGYRKNGHF
ncbi:hypothetical protein RUMCAL_01313, partial [Ruminococcus callidus ATCC 27760]